MIDGTYFCPDVPDNGSLRRKPAPGMILEAQQDHALDLARSFMVGDKPIDVECGRNAGVRTILVRTGKPKPPGRSWRGLGGARSGGSGRDYSSSCAFKVVGIIPARWGSTRFPGKPLHLIAGKPLLRHVWERAGKARALDSVIIATDDMRIAEAAFAWGAEVALTSSRHRSGTDRVAEVVAKFAGVYARHEHPGRRAADRSEVDRSSR